MPLTFNTHTFKLNDRTSLKCASMKLIKTFLDGIDNINVPDND